MLLHSAQCSACCAFLVLLTRDWQTVSDSVTWRAVWDESRLQKMFQTDKLLLHQRWLSGRRQPRVGMG